MAKPGPGEAKKKLPPPETLRVVLTRGREDLHWDRADARDHAQTSSNAYKVRALTRHEILVNLGSQQFSNFN